MIRNASSSLAEGIDTVTRQVKLSHPKNKRRHWHHGDLFMSHLINAASFLPEKGRFLSAHSKDAQNPLSIDAADIKLKIIPPGMESWVLN